MRKLIAIMLLTLGSYAYADDPLHTGACAHQQDQQKVTYECLEEVYDELSQSQGETGPMGPAGPAGPQGERGPQGEPGKDGRDGVVPTGWYDKLIEYGAATQAATAYLPMDKDDRITFGFARASGRTGVGLGYARLLNEEDQLAVTFSIGRSGDTTVGQATIGWEF